MPKNSTIAAFATPSGTSALAVIRVSGQLVREIAEKAFGNKKPFPRAPFSELTAPFPGRPWTIAFGFFTKLPRLIREKMRLRFHATEIRSFSGAFWRTFSGAGAAPQSRENSRKEPFSTAKWI